MSKGGSGGSMTQAGGQSSFGGQMPMQQGYRSPFGNQNYRSQPSQPTFNNYSYQQPGQFGGQMMNQSMRSPGSKGGYQPPMRQQMPSPGGKGRSYQSQQMPFGYGQSTFNPGRFGGYGQPSNMFSFSSPHYQPYVPPVYEPPPPPPPPYRGDDPRDSGVTSSPPSTGSKGGTQRPMPDYSSSGATGYQPSFGGKGGSQPSFGGKGGYYQSTEQPSQTGDTVQQPVQQPSEERVFTPPPLGNNPPPTPDYGFTLPTTQPPAVNSRPIYSNDPPPAPDYGFTPRTQPPVETRTPFRIPYDNEPLPPPTYDFTPPTQPPAPVSDQVLTPVMPKPTPPSREVPEFASVGGIGGNKQPTGRPPSLQNYIDQNQYGTAEDELLERVINMGPGSFDDSSLVDMLKKSYGGIGSLIGPSGLPGRSESFTPPKNPLHTLLAERGFQMPERNQGAYQTADMGMHGIDPVTGQMRFGSGSNTEYYRKLDEMYAQNPEALEIAKQYHADQLKKEKESAQGGIFNLQAPLKQITYSPNQPVPQRNMNMGPGNFNSPFGRLR